MPDLGLRCEHCIYSKAIEQHCPRQCLTCGKDEQRKPVITSVESIHGLFRASRQNITAVWVAQTFGQDCLMNIQERVARVLEEALELAQAHDLPLYTIHRLIDRVWSRPKGDPAQELGGLGVTLLGYAEAAGLDADEQESIELARVLNVDPEKFRIKHDQKGREGVSPSLDARATA